MDSRSVDRGWLIGGVLGAVVLLALAYLLAIGPALQNLASVQDQTDQSDLTLSRERTRLAQLQQQNGQLATYQAALATAQLALPGSNGTADYLRDLNKAAATNHVTIDNLSVSAPAQVAGQTPTVFALPITASAVGAAANTERFLKAIQESQNRAVLVTGVSTAADAKSQVTMTVNMQAFVGSAATAK